MAFAEVPGTPPATDGVPRDGRQRPLIVPRQGGKPKSVTRMSSFTDCLEDKTNLGKYDTRNAMVGLAINDGLRASVRDVLMHDEDDDGNRTERATAKTINDLTAADKRKLNAMAERAQKAAGSEKKSTKGTDLHALTELVDAGQVLAHNLDEKDLMDMAAYVAETIDFEVLDMEQFVVVEELGAGGTFDRRLRYNGLLPDNKVPQLNVFIGDLKTGNVQWGGIKIAGQLAGYSRGWLYDWTHFPVNVNDDKEFTAWKKTEFSEEQAAAAYTKLEGVNQDWGIVINLPAGTGEASLHWVDLNLGWEAALEAVRIRALRSRSGKALLPFAA